MDFESWRLNREKSLASPYWVDASRAAWKAAQPKWMPIETAPKDVEILLCGVMDHPKDYRYKTGGWDEVSNRWYVIGASWEPTHWMPIPPREEE